jgi:hypothetical protein
MTVRDADTKANFLAWYKDVFGFTDPVADTFYDEQLLQDKKTLVELSDSEIDSIMRAIRRTQAIAENLWHGLSLPYSGSSTKTAPSARLAYQPLR